MKSKKRYNCGQITKNPLDYANNKGTKKVHRKTTRPKKSPDFLLYPDLYPYIDLPGCLIGKILIRVESIAGRKTIHTD
jgi:hypothetical protein